MLRDSLSFEERRELERDADRFVRDLPGRETIPSVGRSRESSELTPQKVHGITRCLADVKPERIEWLCLDRIPLGKITILEGDPGLGKSTFLMDLTARVTRGDGLPDEPCSEPASVILLSAEDSMADTVRPRLDAAGADCTRVHSLDGFTAPSGAVGEITLGAVGDPSSLMVLEEAIVTYGARLVIVDVLNAYLSNATDTYRDHDIRRALRPLAELAERTRCAIVVVRHLRKAGTNAINAGGGSVAIGAAARSVLVIHRDPSDSDRRVLAVVKCNVAAIPESLSFRIVASGTGTSRIEWLGASPHTAESLIEARASDEGEAGNRTAVEACMECLREWLTPNGMERREALKLGTAAGFGERTVERARHRLGVLHRSTGFGSTKRSHWSLPSFLPSEPIPDNPPLTSGSGSIATAGRNVPDRGLSEADVEREAIQFEGQSPPWGGP